MSAASSVGRRCRCRCSTSQLAVLIHRLDQDLFLPASIFALHHHRCTVEGREVHSSQKALDLLFAPLGLHEACEGKFSVMVRRITCLYRPLRQSAAICKVLLQDSTSTGGCDRQDLFIDRGRGVVGSHRQPLNVQKLAFVEAFDHPVTADPRLRVALEDRPEARPAAAMLRKQRRMEIDAVRR
eukprot:CAMPEP_0195023526 /NCGR_PEP_ID=MMETSP0326_2-20130528/43112_1 /TAXON_ID=2866 ORGANISM="Crypthecodinium cohnii, Strain Seligo" /NCGR_SAMPLE_ID=MMETSP0326_2 /ASSEMBLY_ACC=CAM_ASM_000348 /LENGTH=182 /DNA_ID=CAMNT_0040043867 /DNA_START=99 /DNA_END=647 /DNA_ORIENTATION=+